MAGISKVAVFGAGGTLGTHVVQSLIDAGFPVTVISRPASRSSFPQSVTVIKAEYSFPDLKEALLGQDAVVSCVGVPAQLDQKVIIDAAEAAGVKRFIPSEFANSPYQNALAELKPFRALKWEILDYVRERAAGNSDFTWTALATGVFIDLAISKYSSAFGFSIADRTARIYDSGNEPFTGSTLKGIAQGVTGILKNPTATVNQHLHMRSIETTQNRILAAFEAATGEKWTVVNLNAQEVLTEAKEKFQRGDRSGIGNMVAVQLFEDGTGRSIVASKEEAANPMLGVEEVDESQLVKDILSSL